MNQECWVPHSKSGFLMQPDPVADISTCDAPICTAHATLLQELATTLPDLIKTGRIRLVLEDMPIIDMTAMQYDAGGRIVERAFQILSLIHI